MHVAGREPTKDTRESTTATTAARPVPRWVAPGFALAAACTIPWVVFLASTLPRSVRVNDRLAWVGFDVGLVVMLALTAYLAWRGRPKVALASMTLATMLVVDAWFDVNTSAAGTPREIALGMAVIEVGLAGVCLWIALHAATVVRRRLEYLARREIERELRRLQRDRDHAVLRADDGLSASPPSDAATERPSRSRPHMHLSSYVRLERRTTASESVD